MTVISFQPVLTSVVSGVRHRALFQSSFHRGFRFGVSAVYISNIVTTRGKFKDFRLKRGVNGRPNENAEIDVLMRKSIYFRFWGSFLINNYTVK